MARFLPLSRLALFFVVAASLSTPACSPRARIGVEAVLAETGLPKALFDKAYEHSGIDVSVERGEHAELVEKLKKGELDAMITDGDLNVETLLREGVAGSAEPLFHHEVVLVGPKEDPASIHQQRSFANSLRALIEGSAAFYRCVGCGARAREDAIFAEAGTSLPRRGSSFIDAGKSEDEVVRAMQGSPGYALLSRPTVLRYMKKGEWSFKPMWSGDALQADTYKLVARPQAKIDEARREGVRSLGAWLKGDEARSIVEKFGADAVGQPIFKAGRPAPGQGFKL